MKNILTVAALATSAALFSVAAQAQDDGLTRAQVTAELQQARASGALERMYSEGFGLPQPFARSAEPALASVEQPAARKPAAGAGPSVAQVRAEAARTGERSR